MATKLTQNELRLKEEELDFLEKKLQIYLYNDFGDISTYKETQEKITVLKEELENVEILPTINIGSVITAIVTTDENESTETFVLLGAPIDGINVSYCLAKTELGRKLLGCKVSDVVSIETPDGITNYEITGIRF